jgi:hypothetical protein
MWFCSPGTWRTVHAPQASAPSKGRRARTVQPPGQCPAPQPAGHTRSGRRPQLVTDVGQRHMEACSHPERKRHAQLRHQPRATPLWVGDPDDWALVRQRPRPPLVCPEPGCNVELISYENLHNQYNPRIFKFKHDGTSCNHWIPDSHGGGGPPSPEHVWMQLYLTRIVTSLWYTATPEHPPTRADVFVHECS